MLTKQSMIDVKIQQMTKFKLFGLLENNLNWVPPRFDLYLGHFKGVE